MGIIDKLNKDFVIPNKKEFEMVVGNCRDEQELVQKGLQLLYQRGL